MARRSANKTRVVTTTTFTDRLTGRTTSRTVYEPGASSAGNTSYRGLFTSVFGAIVLILIFLNLFLSLQGTVTEPFTFTRFLQVLEKVPKLDFSGISAPPNLLDSWQSKVPNFVIEAVGYFLNIWNWVLFLAQGVSQLVLFIAYFLQFLIPFA